MAKIYEIQPIVEKALEEQPETRGDNFLLYLAVLRQFIDTEMSLKAVFQFHKELHIPSLESITRVRRKLQEKRPELRDKKADKVRADEQVEYEYYSRK